jgi:hypothetical protein
VKFCIDPNFTQILGFHKEIFWGPPFLPQYAIVEWTIVLKLSYVSEIDYSLTSTVKQTYIERRHIGIYPPAPKTSIPKSVDFLNCQKKHNWSEGFPKPNLVHMQNFLILLTFSVMCML